MAGQQHLYRRGPIYWWRRVLPVCDSRSYDIRISLRTAAKNEARERAGYLTALAGSAAVLNFANEIDVVEDRRVTATELRSMYKAGLEEALARFISLQNTLPGQPVINRQMNQASEDYYQWMIDTGGRQTELQPAYESQLTMREYDDGRIDRLKQVIAHYQTSQPAINPSSIDRLLMRTGLPTTRTNYEMVRQELWVAYRDAAIGAEADRVHRSPAGASMRAAEAQPQKADTNATDTASPAVTVAPAGSGGAPDPQPLSVTAAVTKPAVVVTLEMARDECIKNARPKNGISWPSEPQVLTAMRLLIHCTGKNFPISELTQVHIGAMAKLMNALPNRWGRTADELAHGIPASLARAEKMVDKTEVGVTVKTQQKHFTWVKKVTERSTFLGYPPGGELKFTGLRKQSNEPKVRARDLRANWQRPEIEHMLRSPIWIGCKGLKDVERLVPGPLIFHDAWYFAPLAFMHMAGRSSEIMGVPLCDVHDDAPIPYFGIEGSKLRRLKTVQSRRCIPIHPELIRLGFVDYIRAVRDDGHELLFPEMHNPNSKSFAKTFYGKVLKPLRRHAFPNGTEWRHKSGGAWIDKSVHSFRGLAASMMAGRVPDSVIEDILGHEGTTSTTKVYRDPTPLDVMLDAMLLTVSLTSSLQAVPLNMRPLAHREFSATAGVGGRPKSIAK